MHTKTPLLTFALGAVVLSTFSLDVAYSQQWTEWEHENSVAQHGSFLVINNFDEFCFVKQSYAEQPGRFEFMTKGEGFVLLNPHFMGFSEDVTYWIDSGTKHTLPASVGDEFSFELTDLQLDRLEAGTELFIKVSPRGERPRVHSISLSGFGEAYKMLGSESCES